MKKLLLASALVAFSSTAAFAEGGPLSSIKPDASLEYAFEAKKWSGDVGVTASVYGISVRPAADFSYASGSAVASEVETAYVPPAPKAEEKTVEPEPVTVEPEPATIEPEKPTSLENLNETTCKWPIGHPDEESFYFCGRSPEGDFPYCKLHVLYAFQPKGQKEEVLDKEDDVPVFLEKKIKSA